MALETWLAYVATVLLLMSTPGPSHLLMLSNSLRHGFAPATATAAGDLSANTLQILAAGFGLVGVIFASETAFTVVKWAGVAYLVYVGLRLFLRAPPVPGAAPTAVSRRKLYMQGFVTSAANPKAVVFFAALFPQFIDPAAPLAAQIAILGATYIVVDGTFLGGYGLFAGWVGRRMKERFMYWLDRVAGTMIIAAAVLLGFKDIEARR
jgi:threonine/homoserine/homoserine lactone efflux protein